MSQLSFDFPFEDCYLTEEFLVTETNSSAFNFVINYDLRATNLSKIFAICGQPYCGKTHLTHIWQRKFKANFLYPDSLENINFLNYIQPQNCYIIEDIDKITDQKTLLHIFNLITEKDAYLLITSAYELSRIKYDFADLSSRLKNIFCLNIKEPDFQLTKMLLIKNFSLRQLAVKDQVINYLSNHIERDFTAIHQLVKIVGFYCFEEKREITIPLVNKALKALKAC